MRRKSTKRHLTNSLLNCDEFGISIVLPFLDRRSRAFRRFSLFTFRGGVVAFVSIDCSSSKSSSIDESRRFSMENFIPNDLSMHVAAWPITLENTIMINQHTQGVWKSQKKVSFNFASEASYAYILNGQKLIKNYKNCPFWRDFDHLQLAVKQCYQTGQF